MTTDVAASRRARLTARAEAFVDNPFHDPHTGRKVDPYVAVGAGVALVELLLELLGEVDAP